MKRHNIWLAAACVTCATLVWSYDFGLKGTEFSGGRTTGPLLHLSDLGLILFAAALVVTFFYLRVAALMTVIASLLCLPLYIYFAAPGAFRHVFPGDYSAPAQAHFVWNNRIVAGIFCLLAAACLGIRTLLARSAEA